MSPVQPQVWSASDVQKNTHTVDTFHSTQSIYLYRIHVGVNRLCWNVYIYGSIFNEWTFIEKQCVVIVLIGLFLSLFFDIMAFFSTRIKVNDEDLKCYSC